MLLTIQKKVLNVVFEIFLVYPKNKHIRVRITSLELKKKRGRGDLLLNARALHHNKHQFLFTPYTWRRKKLGKVEDQSDRRPVIHLPGFSAN